MEDVTVQEQSSVDFECTLTAPVAPERIKWLVGGEPVSPDDERFCVSADGPNLKLTMYTVSTEDAGEVTVRVGPKESTAKLSVQGKKINSIDIL